MELARRLVAILDELVTIRDGGQPAISADGSEADPDLDDAYIYLEANLPGSSDLEIDISIHKGRAFFRIERRTCEPTTVDEPHHDHAFKIDGTGMLAIR
jgi:HSP20 family molecular chaperone IbpA